MQSPTSLQEGHLPYCCVPHLVECMAQYINLQSSAQCLCQHTATGALVEMLGDSATCAAEYFVRKLSLIAVQYVFVQIS